MMYTIFHFGYILFFESGWIFMELFKKSIDSIIRDKKLLDLLNNVEINSIEELCSYSQKDLIAKQIPNFYIKDISIALQSNGLDLRKNKKR